jgi:hypothetical protein
MYIKIISAELRYIHILILCLMIPVKLKARYVPPVTTRKTVYGNT